MSNKIKILLVVIVIAIAATLVIRNRLKKAVSQLDYGIADGVKVLSMNLSTTTIAVPVWVFNPSALNVTISNMEMNLYVNKQFAGKILLNRTIIIAAKSNSIIPLEFSTNNTQLMQILINNAKYFNDNSWREKLNIAVMGTLRAEAGMIYIDTLPVSADGTYKYWMG